MNLADAFFVRGKLGWCRCLGLCGGWCVAVRVNDTWWGFCSGPSPPVPQPGSRCDQGEALGDSLEDLMGRRDIVESFFFSMPCLQVRLLTSNHNFWNILFCSQTPCGQKRNCDFQSVTAHLAPRSQTFSLIFRTLDEEEKSHKIFVLLEHEKKSTGSRRCLKITFDLAEASQNSNSETKILWFLQVATTGLVFLGPRLSFHADTLYSPSSLQRHNSLIWSFIISHLLLCHVQCYLLAPQSV